MTEPREITPEEARDIFMRQIAAYARSWASADGLTNMERCSGLAFSILNIFDGTAAFLPAFNIHVSPHPDDKDYRKRNGENWFVDGQCINDDCMLHEEWHPKYMPGVKT